MPTTMMTTTEDDDQPNLASRHLPVVTDTAAGFLKHHREIVRIRLDFIVIISGSGFPGLQFGWVGNSDKDIMQFFFLSLIWVFLGN